MLSFASTKPFAVALLLPLVVLFHPFTMAVGGKEAGSPWDDPIQLTIELLTSDNEDLTGESPLKQVTMALY